jgi:hypothetical protein
MTQQKTCQNCKDIFIVGEDDLSSYEKIMVPPPTWCPECRLVRRLLWRNERSLYKRTCDLCKEPKILMYPSVSPYNVYCYPCWWSDAWQAGTYAREYDFSKPFFEQFRELLLTVPRPGIIKQKNQIESEYTNRVTDMRNCYLLFGSTDDEYCRYGSWFNFCKECVDCYHIEKCERCYECVDCYGCSALAFSQESNSCSSSWFLSNCTNCQNCFGCVNLRSKSYCIFNKQYSKEEYEKLIATFDLGSADSVRAAAQKFHDFKMNFIVPAIVSHHSTGVSGNWIENSKNVEKSFSCSEVEEGRYLFSVFKAKDVMDYSFWGSAAERVYETINTGIQVSDISFANECWTSISKMRYVMNCHNSNNLFGCIGLRNSEYCILNKKYEKDAYVALLPKIREHMAKMPYVDAKGRSFGYGEFFPPEISPFSYNETIAQELFPIDTSKAGESGFSWKEPDAKMPLISMSPESFPDAVKDAPSSIPNEIVGCEHNGACAEMCTVAFRILAEDLRLYKSANLPLPRLCPNCRHFERLKKRTPLESWKRKCHCAGDLSDKAYKNNVVHFHGDGSCPNEFDTSYAPDRPEIVYCLQCYNAEVV